MVQGEVSVTDGIPVGSLVSGPSLMHLNSDNGLSAASNLACGGPASGKVNQFPAQELSAALIPQPGLSTSPVGGPCIESRHKADNMMMVCEMKELAGDLHAALLCCNQAALSYQQCIKTMQSSANVSSPELNTIRQKCNAAIETSRRIHALIQSKYDEARTNHSKQSQNLPVAPCTSACVSCTPAQSLSSSLSSRTMTLNSGNLIQLDESMPSVRQQVLKEQLGDLYRQPCRANAFRNKRAGGVVAFLQPHGHDAASSQPKSEAHSTARDHSMPQQ